MSPLPVTATSPDKVMSPERVVMLTLPPVLLMPATPTVMPSLSLRFRPPTATLPETVSRSLAVLVRFTPAAFTTKVCPVTAPVALIVPVALLRVVVSAPRLTLPS